MRERERVRESERGWEKTTKDNRENNDNRD
jgi:hypothetical protein